MSEEQPILDPYFFFDAAWDRSKVVPLTTSTKDESMSEEYTKEIHVTEDETSHPGFPYAMAKARFAMEPPVLDVDPGAPACDILHAAAEELPYWPPITPSIYGAPNPLLHFLETILGDHEVRELEHGTYEHTFTPKDWPFRMASETESLRDGPCVPATYHVINQRAVRLILKARAEDRKQERWRKIRRKQKRAAFRRKRKGLA